jgi:hypothetical protein
MAAREPADSAPSKSSDRGSPEPTDMATPKSADMASPKSAARARDEITSNSTYVTACATKAPPKPSTPRCRDVGRRSR